MYCDFHTHTNHSDGSYSPTELAKAAAEKNLIVALTDHNTISGLAEFLAEADRLGVTAIGDNLEQAIEKAYDLTKKVEFSNGFYRSDIGKHALKAFNN